MSAERQLGLISATALVVASMVGTGVFTTSGFLLRDLGSPWLVLAAWGAGGGIAALGAVSYGALARRLPESGGEYLFLTRTLHPAAGYVAGWVSLLVGFSAPLAAAAFALGEYTAAWWPRVPPRVTGSLLMLLFTAVHSVHVQRGAWVQNAAVTLKLALLAVFVVVAARRLAPEPSPPVAAFPLAAFAVSLVWISFSYSGWNAAVYVGGEVRDAKRTLPRALLLGTGAVALLYMGLNAVFVFGAPGEALAGQVEVARIAARALGGAGLADAVTVLIVLALATTISSMVMAGPRVYARMAADGCLPRFLAMRAGPPRTSIAFQTAVALVLLWSATFESLLTYIGFTLGVSTAATVLGLMLVRRREGAADVPVLGWPWVPVVFLVSVLGITGFTIAARPVESLGGLLTLGIGWVFWYATARRERAA